MAVIHRARVVDARQQGSRISEFDSLFETVEQVPPPPLQEPIPVPETTELQWPVLVEEVQQ